VKKCLLILLSLLLLLPLGCADKQSAVEINFADLAANPQNYNGKEIAITGYWFDGFEIAVLAEKLEETDFPAGNLRPAGIKIWMAGGLPEDIGTKLYLQENDITGYPAHYGKLKLSGTLEYGEGYGHLNSYAYRLTIYEAQWLEWSPHPVSTTSR